ncbi:MAG: hypothetical protein AAFP90_21065, partial [Planctomycetota bacterium]
MAALVANGLIAIGFEDALGGALIARGRGDGSCLLALFGDVHEGGSDEILPIRGPTLIGSPYRLQRAGKKVGGKRCQVSFAVRGSSLVDLGGAWLLR